MECTNNDPYIDMVGYPLLFAFLSKNREESEIIRHFDFSRIFSGRTTNQIKSVDCRLEEREQEEEVRWGAVDNE